MSLTCYGEVAPSDLTDLCLIWNSPDSNKGWVIIAADSTLISAYIVPDSGPTLNFSSTRDRAKDRLLVEINLSPIDVRIAGTTKGYALRIARDSNVVELKDVKNLLAGPAVTTYFCAASGRGELIAKMLEKSKAKLPLSVDLFQWKESNLLQFEIPFGVNLKPEEKTKSVLPIP